MQKSCLPKLPIDWYHFDMKHKKWKCRWKCINETKQKFSILLISDNSISAIISKFEAKNRSIRVKDKISNKMSATETLQSDEVFYDSLLNNSNGNKKSISSSDILPNNADKNFETFKNRTVSSRGKSLINLVSWFVFLLSSVNGAIASTLAFIILLPRALIKSLFYPGYRLLFGTLYPAYASYKAVRTRNVKEYVSNVQPSFRPWFEPWNYYHIHRWNGWCIGSFSHCFHAPKHLQTFSCRGSHVTMKSKSFWCCGCCHQPPKEAQHYIGNLFIQCWRSGSRWGCLGSTR